MKYKSKRPIITVDKNILQSLLSELTIEFDIKHWLNENKESVKPCRTMQKIEDNVLWQERKPDMTEILYSLLHYLKKRANTDGSVKIYSSVFASRGGTLALVIMPTGWSYGWEKEYLRLSVEPFLLEYSPKEAEFILKILTYLNDIDFLSLVLNWDKTWATEVLCYWEKLSFQREKLRLASIILAEQKPTDIHWNEFIQCVLPTKWGWNSTTTTWDGGLKRKYLTAMFWQST